MGISSFGMVRITAFKDGELCFEIGDDEWTCVAQITDVEMSFTTDVEDLDGDGAFKLRTPELHGKVEIQGPLRRSPVSIPISELAKVRKIGHGDKGNMTTPVEKWTMREDD